MKRIHVISAMAIAAVIGLSIPNANALEKDPVTAKTAKAVHQDFPKAKHITWRKQGRNLIATFNVYGSQVTATYSPNGTLSSTLIWNYNGDMPFEIRTKIARKYAGYAVQCVKEYIDQKGRNYYILLNRRNGNQVDWINLQSSNGEELVVLQKLHQII